MLVIEASHRSRAEASFAHIIRNKASCTRRCEVSSGRRSRHVRVTWLETACSLYFLLNCRQLLLAILKLTDFTRQVLYAWVRWTH